MHKITAVKLLIGTLWVKKKNQNSDPNLEHVWDAKAYWKIKIFMVCPVLCIFTYLEYVLWAMFLDNDAKEIICSNKLARKLWHLSSILSNLQWSHTYPTHRERPHTNTELHVRYTFFFINIELRRAEIVLNVQNFNELNFELNFFSLYLSTTQHWLICGCQILIFK